MTGILDKFCSENQNARFMLNAFFPIIVPFMSKNMVEPVSPKMTRQYGEYALHAG
jgi:hypothetical protein